MKLHSPGEWFGRKRSGMGLGPRTWEGWLITGAVVLLVLAFALRHRL